MIVQLLIIILFSVSNSTIISSFLSPRRKTEGKTYYVDASGSDTGNTGSINDPWKTPQHASDQVTAGDVIYFKAGVYDPFQITVSGTVNDPILFSAAPGDEHEVIIDGNGHSIRGNIELRGVSYITIYGFKLINSPSDGLYAEGSTEGERGIKILNNIIDTTGNAGIYVCGLVMGSTIGVNEYRMFDVLIEGNDVTNTNYPDGVNECISVGGGLDGFIIQNNWVHDSDQYGIDAKFGAINGEISNNLIHGMEKHGIYVDTNSRDIYNIKIFNNVVYNNNNGIVLARESRRDPLLPNMYNIDVFNNIVRDNTKYGIMAYKHIADTETGLWDDVNIIDNHIEGNGIDGIRLAGIGHYATNFTVKGNNFVNNVNDIYNDGLVLND